MRSDSRHKSEDSRSVVPALLIFGYILVVLLMAGLARAENESALRIQGGPASFIQNVEGRGFVREGKISPVGTRGGAVGFRSIVDLGPSNASGFRITGLELAETLPLDMSLLVAEFTLVFGSRNNAINSLLVFATEVSSAPLNKWS